MIRFAGLLFALAAAVAIAALLDRAVVALAARFGRHPPRWQRMIVVWLAIYLAIQGLVGWQDAAMRADLAAFDTDGDGRIGEYELTQRQRRAMDLPPDEGGGGVSPIVGAVGAALVTGLSVLADRLWLRR